jgi:hypothetical protein
MDDPTRENKLALAPHHNLQNQSMNQGENARGLYVLPWPYLIRLATEYGTDVYEGTWSITAS